MIYLDNAATTQIDPEVLDAMLPYLTEQYGNPGGIYKFGTAAKQAVEKAREQVAAFVNADPEQIIFTSSGSEANNMAILGLQDTLRAKNKMGILVSEVEHESVLKAAEALRKLGFYVHKLPVNEDGCTEYRDVDVAKNGSTGLVSVMYVNNELGSVSQVDQIGQYCKENDILFHTDCVQAAGTHQIDMKKIGCDFLTLSSHKLHAPKGSGAIVARDKTLIKPLIHGGNEQEFGLRGGTENVPSIVAFGKACEIASRNLNDTMLKVSTLKQRFFMALESELSLRGLDNIVHVNGASVITPGKVINFSIDGVDGQTLVLMASGNGVCISAGSACCSHDIEPSHVLSAIGLSFEQARSSVRVSFSRMNTVEQVIDAASIIASCISVFKGGLSF